MAEQMHDESQLVWSDKFKLGYEPMDETHEEFVEIVNAMLTCADEKLTAQLALFAMHAETHFSQERAWMLATDFPSIDCHVSEHDAVMRSVTEVQDVLANGGSAEVVRRLAEALIDWFPAHADYLDAPLSHWIVKRRLGGVPIVIRRNFLVTI